MATAAAGRREAPHMSIFSARPGRERPGGRRRHRPRAETPAGRDRADRLGEHRLAGRAGGGGQRAHQQVRRRLSGPSLLRRLPIRGRGGDAGDRARQDALQVQVRQRAAALGRDRQPGRVPGPHAAGRHLHGAVAGGRRSSDARLAGEPVGQVVQGGALLGAAAGPQDRHGRGAAASRASTGPR